MNSSAYTVDLFDRPVMSQIPATGYWCERPEIYSKKGFNLNGMTDLVKRSLAKTIQTLTSITDPWKAEEQEREAVVTIRTALNPMLIVDLGWSQEQALETRMRLRTFEEDWDAPGMEGYDEL